MRNYFLGLFCIILLGGCQTLTPKKQTIKIAAAASTQYVLDTLIKAYNAPDSIQIETIISSSGKLTAQIEQGAPYDLFISADTMYPNYLYQKGLGLATPVVYAYGQLVLWTLESYDLSQGLRVLEDEAVEKIALADPKTAPYGELSKAYLNEAGIYETLSPKLVLGESIGQVNQYIHTRTVEIGLTAKSVVMAPQLKEKGRFVTLQGAQLAQAMLLLRKATSSKATMSFYEFLQSSKAKEIFKHYGYVYQS